MLHGKREAEWNHTASLILTMQRVAGNDKAKFSNPFSDRRSRDGYEVDTNTFNKMLKRELGIEK